MSTLGFLCLDPEMRKRRQGMVSRVFIEEKQLAVSEELAGGRWWPTGVAGAADEN